MYNKKMISLVLHITLKKGCYHFMGLKRNLREMYAFTILKHHCSNVYKYIHLQL